MPSQLRQEEKFPIHDGQLIRFDRIRSMRTRVNCAKKDARCASRRSRFSCLRCSCATLAVW